MVWAGEVTNDTFAPLLGGSQLALPGAVDRLRAAREGEGTIVALAPTDPANSYGAPLRWAADDGDAGMDPPYEIRTPHRDLVGTPGRLARAAGAFVVLDAGELRLYLEWGGRSLLTRGQVDVEYVRALAAAAIRTGRVEVQRLDGTPVRQSKLASALIEAGFRQAPRGLVLWRR